MSRDLAGPVHQPGRRRAVAGHGTKVVQGTDRVAGPSRSASLVSVLRRGGVPAGDSGFEVFRVAGRWAKDDARLAP